MPSLPEISFNASARVSGIPSFHTSVAESSRKATTEWEDSSIRRRQPASSALVTKQEGLLGNVRSRVRATGSAFESAVGVRGRSAAEYGKDAASGGI